MHTCLNSAALLAPSHPCPIAVPPAHPTACPAATPLRPVHPKPPARPNSNLMPAPLLPPPPSLPPTHIHPLPPCQERDNAGRPDSEVAAEAWSNYRARNDSVVVDHFQVRRGLWRVCGFRVVSRVWGLECGGHGLLAEVQVGVHCEGAWGEMARCLIGTDPASDAPTSSLLAPRPSHSLSTPHLSPLLHLSHAFVSSRLSPTPCPTPCASAAPPLSHPLHHRSQT